MKSGISPLMFYIQYFNTQRSYYFVEELDLDYI